MAQSATLPGTIQAEDFDQGSSGVAYFDTTSGNAGGQYRGTDVDIEATDDAGGGFNVGWTAPGEWLRYTLNVTTAGTYDLEFRVASRQGGGTFHLEVNGVDRTGPLTIPMTGDWQTWTTVRRTGVALSAGQQVWRIVFDTRGQTASVGNLNYFKVTGPVGAALLSTPYGGAAAVLPGTLQAENFDNGGEGTAYHDLSTSNDGGLYRTTAVDITSTSDSGGGYILGWTAAGEWLNYSVNVAAAGTYDVEARVASYGTGGTFHIEVNGTDRTGPLSIPDTGGWQTWVTILKTGMTLSAGPQLWRIVMDSNGSSGSVGNLNYVRVIASQSGGGATPLTGTPTVLPGVVQAEDFDSGGEGLAFHDLSAGNEGGEYRNTGVDIEATRDSGGGFNVGWTRAGEWLLYTVDVLTAGTYDIEARVAANGSGGRFHIEVNGVDRTGPFTVSDTGGWQQWITLRKTGLSLSAGRQVWRVVMDANGASGGVGNFNYFRLVDPAGSVPLPATGLPAPWLNRDIGAPSLTGSATASSGGFTVTGAGADIWSTADQFHYVYQPLTGDGEIIARVDSFQGPDSWSKAGVMIRETLNASSPHVFATATVGNGWTCQWRSSAAGLSSSAAPTPGTAPGWVRLARRGSVFTGSYSLDGTNWTQIQSVTVSMASNVYVGLAVTSQNTGARATAAFSDVAVRPLSGNQAPTVSLTSPTNGATFTAPASITINATAGDPDGSVTRVDFYRGSTLIASDTTSPYSATWSNPASGTYTLTAVAVDSAGASATSAPVSITVNVATTLPTLVVFTASADHATGVTSYLVSLYRAVDPITATPVASRDVGKPTPVNNDITVDISDIVNPLPSGSYYAVVTARGSGGSGVSTPSASFTK